MAVKRKTSKSRTTADRPLSRALPGNMQKMIRDYNRKIDEAQRIRRSIDVEAARLRR